MSVTSLEMDLLPPADERELLLDELGHLLARSGPGPFVASTILEPTNRHFPDRWSPDAQGVKVLARRLLAWAGLPDLGVDVMIDPGRGRARQGHHEGTAAWFAGIHDGRCQFGAVADHLHDAAAIVAAMAHEVAHAWRAFHGISEVNSKAEELRTDLTTVVLGFGILTANAAYRYRAGGDFDGQNATTWWTHQSLGYLSPQSLAFLLAAQVVARGASAFERRKIAGHLETTQAASFKAACAALDRDALRARLALPPPESWPKPIAEPVSLPERESLPVPASVTGLPNPPPARLANAGQSVFRVIRTRAGHGAAAGMVAGVIVGSVLGRSVPGAGFWLTMGFVLAAALVGWFAGRTLRRDICSDPYCAERVPVAATTCPGCAGTISGAILDPSERLAAEEELAGKSRRRRRRRAAR